MAEPDRTSRPTPTHRQDELRAAGVLWDAKPWTPLVSEHLGLIVSSAAFTVVALRVLGTAGWNPTTAQAIVQAGGAANVALAGALSVVPLIAGLVLLAGLPRYCGIAYRWPSVRHRASVLGIGGVVLLLAANLVDWLIFGFAVFMVLAAVVRGVAVRRLGRTQGPPEPAGFWAGDVLPLVFFAVLLLETVLETSYLPQEQFDTPSTKPFTGYVVGERDASTLVLRKGGGVTAYNTDDLTRELCDSSASETFRELFQESPYPDCPDN
jgi:hypothetical protein